MTVPYLYTKELLTEWGIHLPPTQNHLHPNPLPIHYHIIIISIQSFITYHHTVTILTVMGRNGVNNRIEEKGRLVRIVTFHVRRGRVMIERNGHKSSTVVVHVRVSNTPFRTNRNTNDDLVNIIKFIPIFIHFLQGK